MFTTQLMFVFSVFPMLASVASIARGCPPRQIGQKPEPTIRRRTAHQSLPPGGRGTAIAVEGARVTFSLHGFYCYALSLSRLRRQLPPGGSLFVNHIITRVCRENNVSAEICL